MVMQGIGGRKLAATVLLVRDGIINGRPDVEVYIQERVSTMANFPRATVFPVGVLILGILRMVTVRKCGGDLARRSGVCV